MAMSQRQYQYPLAHYPTVYGVSYRTILRWAAKAYPLDDEAATRALVAGQKNGSAGKSAPRESTEAARTLPRAVGGELGLAAAIRRLQTAEAEAHAEYDQAKASGGDAAQATARAKAWLALSEQLRKVEQSTPEVEQANKKSLRIDELQRELGSLFVRLRQDLESMPQRIGLELVGKDEIGIREVLKREAGEIIHALYSCKYLAAEDGSGGSEE
jgi:hypothetical protein